MFLISGPDLVLAACKAGIVGAFPTPNARPIDLLDAWMKQITEGLAKARDEEQPNHTIGPWCANLVTHSSNARLPEDLELIAKYQPPLVVTALGSSRIDRPRSTTQTTASSAAKIASRAPRKPTAHAGASTSG